MGRVEACRVLVEEGNADVNQQTIEGTTPLIVASMHGYMEIG